MIFKKIDLVLPPLDLARVKGEPLEDYGTNFYSFFIKDRDYLDQILKDRIKFNITPDNFTYNEVPNGTSHHSHTNEVSLNYYIDSSFGAATLFFQPKAGEVGYAAGRILPDGSLVESIIINYKTSQLRYMDKFCPKAGDAYLFNASQVHSVVRLLNVPSTRKIFRWVWWNYSIEEILNSIEILS